VFVFPYVVKLSLAYLSFRRKGYTTRNSQLSMIKGKISGINFEIVN